jgi:hypothetical protein
VRAVLLAAADRVVPAELAVLHHSAGFGTTRLLGAMVELGVIDALAAGPARASELASRLDLHSDSLHRALRAVSVARIVRLDSEGRFTLTRLGRVLVSERTPTLREWVRYLNLDSTQAGWAVIAESIRTGEPGFPLARGRSIWAHFADHPEEERIFAGAMRNFTTLDLPFVVGGYPWPDEGTICDVGGGVGALLAGILTAKPGLLGVCVDAPGVLEAAEPYLHAAGVRRRVELKAGDMFDQVDAEADVYLLRNILHDWDDERCVRILGTVRGAMRPGARVVVVEAIQDPNRPDPFASLSDIHMLAETDGGRERSVSELEALFRAAGLEPGAVRRTAGPALLEATAP